MKQIFEEMTIIILLLISILVHTTMIMANLEISEARNFHANAIEEIQASNFDKDVILEKKTEATDRGWTLTCESVQIYDDRQDMKVTLEYDLAILPIVSPDTRSLVGYAR